MLLSIKPEETKSNHKSIITDTSKKRKTFIDKQFETTAFISVDAEWQNKTHDSSKFSPESLEFYTRYILPVIESGVNQSYPLLVQVALNFRHDEKYIFFIDSRLYKRVKIDYEKWLETSKRYDIQLISIDNIGVSNLLEKALQVWEIELKTKINLLMFYSPKDLEFLFGRDFWLHLLDHKLVEQKRNIKVSTKVNKGKWLRTESGYELKFIDMKGYQGKGTLHTLGSSVNVPMRAKEKLDNLKGHMIEAVLNHTETFLEYSYGDVECLPQIYKAYNKLFTDICKECFNLNLDNELPTTTGAQVAMVFEKWLNSLMGDKAHLFEFADTKLSLLNPEHRHYKTNKGVWSKLVRTVKSIKICDDIHKGINTSINSKTYARFKELRLGNRLQYKGYSQSSVVYYAHKMSHNTSGLNALVQGGRCNNERPEEYYIKIVLDIDLNGCYGSALKQFYYPLGLPDTIGFTENEDYPSLKDFLTKYESELVDGLYTLTVSTSELLSFTQDLIYSKLGTLDGIGRAYVTNFKEGETDLDSSISDWSKKEDPANIPGDFILCLREIKNGIITSEVLKTLKAVSTVKEWNELKNKLKVTNAAIYKKSDRVETLEEWIEIVIEDTGTYGSTTGKVRDIKDNRTTKWYGVPLSLFLDKLLDKRGDIKQQKRAATGEKKAELSSVDAMLKLFINTLYGVFASPYFAIGNTVLANNITAKARVGAWKMNKALHTRLSITDGGFYTPVKVPYLDNTVKNFEKPGLNSLTNNLHWGDNKVKRAKGQKFKSLGGLDWELLYKSYSDKINCVKGDDKVVSELRLELSALADKLAFEHIQTFWSMYGLELGFNIEHKETNTALTGSYWSKGHYSFNTIDGRNEDKIRGAKDFKEKHLKKSPMFELLGNIKDGNDNFPDDLTSNHFYLLKINEFNKARNSKGYQHLDGLYPGDAVILERNQKFNNTHFRIETLKTFETMKTRKEYRMIKGVRVEVPKFEKYASKGIKEVNRQMRIDAENLNKKYGKS